MQPDPSQGVTSIGHGPSLDEASLIPKLPRDATGYQVTHSDLGFLAISESSFANWVERYAPLGMTPEQMYSFTRRLIDALRQDGVHNVDVRLQGSSANFFSGLHKEMEYDAERLLECYRAERNRVPLPEQIHDAVRMLNSQWPSDALRPTQRPFDILYRIGIAKYPSDFDIQISSNEMVRRVRVYLEEFPGSPLWETMISPAYRFVRREWVDRVFVNLKEWSIDQTETFRRSVTVALFPSVGPPDMSNSSPVSSHFKNTDWMIGKWKL